MYAGVNIYGPLGSNVLVQFSTSLATNATWTTLTNITIQKQPEIVIDYTSPEQPGRFYRTVPQ
jgi:hypothetical protein